MEKIDNIINFWFSDITKDTDLNSFEGTKKWFAKNDEFDAKLKQAHEGDIIRARKGKYEKWLDSARGRLALILLYDQFSRNIYRNTEKAFENDLKALEICLLMIKDGQDEKMLPAYRQFVYMPMMHSENKMIQEKSLIYFKKLQDDALEAGINEKYFEGVYNFAVKHYDIIDQFDRYPHRNDILKRRSTQEELVFLESAGSSF